MENEILYKFCKNYVKAYDEVEKAEEKNRMKAEYELDYYIDDEPIDYLSREACKAGLQALIVDDFVKQLPHELQQQVIMECMKIKTGGSFKF